MFEKQLKGQSHGQNPRVPGMSKQPSLTKQHSDLENDFVLGTRLPTENIGANRNVTNIVARVPRSADATRLCSLAVANR